jgi:hypothetical protein
MARTPAQRGHMRRRVVQNSRSKTFSFGRGRPLEHGDLLSEGEDLNCSVMPTAEEYSDSGHESNNGCEHEL